MALGLVALRQQAADELQQFLRVEASAFPGLKWVLRSLQAPGKLLSPDKDAFAWGLLPLLVVEAAGKDPLAGLPLAIAVECLISASDVLDDVQDRDSATGPERECGVPTAINVGVFLFTLAQLAILRLADQGADPHVVQDIDRVFLTAVERACCGQQQDIDQDDALLTEDDYLAMVRSKSGALVEGVCRASAILAGAPPKAIEGYADFGRNLGIALQVSNDVRAASSAPDRRNDVALGKRRCRWSRACCTHRWWQTCTLKMPGRVWTRSVAPSRTDSGRT